MPRAFNGDGDYEAMRRLVSDACGLTSPPYATLGDLDWWRATGEPGESAACTLWHGADQALEAFLWPSATQVDILTRCPDTAVYEQALHHVESHRTGSPLCWSFSHDSIRNQVLSRRGYTRTKHSFSLQARSLDRPPPVVPLQRAVTIRQARAHDAAPIALTHRAAFSSNRLSASNFERVMNSPTFRPELHLVAERESGIAGYIIAWLDPHNHIGLIEPLAVEPNSRGVGLANALLSAALTRLSAAGARTALVNTAPDNPGAAALYAAAGFKEWDRNWAWTFGSPLVP